MSDDLRPPTKENPRQPDDYRRIDMAADVVGTESHRGAIVFAGSLADESLASLVRSKFRTDEWSAKNVVQPMFEGYGPLATFSSRINYAYAAGLICREAFDALHLLRKLRNDFAHEPRPINLDDQKVKNRFVAFANIFGFSGRPLMRGQAPEEVGFRFLLATLMGALEAYLHGCIAMGEAVPWIQFPKDVPMDGLAAASLPAARAAREARPERAGTSEKDKVKDAPPEIEGKE